MFRCEPLYIDWTPDVDVFTIGSFSIRWYSLLWCIGLLLAYLIVQRLYKQQKIEQEKFEPLFFYCFLGVLIGARLGHCIFYEPGYYLTSLTGFVEMFIPFRLTSSGEWHFTGYEGLASHGGTIGLFVALMIYCRKHKVGVWTVLDNIAIAVPITAACIRLGNLMNSEIIGNPTDVAWAFIFHSHEALVDGQLVPRHPAQLYEAIAYVLIFIGGILLYRSWYKSKVDSVSADSSENEVAVCACGNAGWGRSSLSVGTGFYFGYCLATIFLFRFFVEFLKKEQVEFETNMLLDMGQLLSIPFVLIGIVCMIRAKKSTTKK